MKGRFGKNSGAGNRPEAQKEVNMVTATRVLVTAILLAALPATGRAQDAKALLNTVVRSMGAENLRTLHWTASGSLYDEKGQHIVVKSYTRTMDFNATTSTGRTVTAAGTPPMDQATNVTVNSNSPWDAQLDFWITPFAFLKGASTHGPALETKSLFGQSYRVLSFTLPGNHRVSGFINAKDMVERVQVAMENGTAMEGIYHDYADFGGLKVPSVMIQQRGGALSQVLVVKEVKPNG
jgi:hypothetical protein